MKSTLRETLHISGAADAAEVERVCGEYYAIYKNIAACSTDPVVRRLAEERIKALEDAACAENVPLPTAVAVSDTPAAPSPTQVPEFLAGIAGNLTVSEFNRQKAVLDAMPDCAEKYYLFGCLMLAKGPIDPDDIRHTASYFYKATEMDATNAAYIEVCNMFGAAIKAFTVELQAWQEHKKQVDDDYVVRVKRKHFWEKVWEITKGVGKVLLTVLGAVAAAAVGAIGCLCECADGC